MPVNANPSPTAPRHCSAGPWATFGAFVLFLAVAQASTEAQAQAGFAERAERALAEPYVGVTTDGTPRSGLYRIAPTGIDTGPLRNAALDLIAALPPEQRARLRFAADDIQWRSWINIHRFPRDGVALHDLDETQRDAVYALLKASLSARGYQTTRDIMRLNHHLGELVSNFEDYGEHRYWIALMGEPSERTPWGWQLEGHHLIINFFVLGDQVVMTPTFMGSEPITARSGKYEGVEILQPEQDRGLAFMRSLTFEQQSVARLGPRTEQNANKTEAFKDNAVLPYEGAPVRSMSAEQRSRLLDLIALYVGNIRTGHAKVKMDEVAAHLDETYFAWRGGTDADAVFYYRIHSPVVLIEFDHAGTIALDGPWGEPKRRHIHTVVRTPNGNDYGKDLLRQHYESHAGDRSHGHSHAN